jgi:hypothetical protein
MMNYNLFANVIGFEITIGLIKTEQFNIRRRREFMLFMHEVIVESGNEKEMRGIIDNLTSRKTKNSKWFA